MNAKKTEVMIYNTAGHPPLRTRDGSTLKVKEDFKYLGSWVNSSEKDIKVRKAIAWRALNGMNRVWKSNLPRDTKLHFFEATVESVLLYGCENWTLKADLQKSLDGCYTRMLRVVLDIDRKLHITNEELYRGRPKLSNKIAARRMRLAGHCHRHKELPAGKLVLWEPTPRQGHRSRGGVVKTFVDILKKDTRVETVEEIAKCMEDRDDWRDRWDIRLWTT